VRMPSTRERLDPRRFGIGRMDSAWWHWLVNDVAASPAISRPARKRMLEAAGFEVGTAIVESGIRFYSNNIGLGDWCVLNSDCYIDNRERVEIGDGAGLAYAVMICTSTHDLGDEAKRFGTYRTEPVTIGAGAWVGARATVLPGVTIAPGCVIGAGAVVTKNTEPNGLYVGIPARRTSDL
jgi:maltose O-acetyltransferase